MCAGQRSFNLTDNTRICNDTTHVLRAVICLLTLPPGLCAIGITVRINGNCNMHTQPN
jgi:hypothetical protein